jgi:XTP/dITP diphosphohydrolase
MSTSRVLQKPGMKLYLASANPGKLREFREAAQARGIRLESVPDICSLPPCIEDGLSFEDNAGKKALYYSACTDGLVFADDSGICVDALNGAPGVHSARFAGPDADDDANNQKLLTELRRVEESNAAEAGLPLSRAAHYICIIVLAQKARVLKIVEGRVDGIIIDPPRGSGGFGYDPYFFYPPLGKTFAEITTEEKFVVSHRGKAFRRLLDCLS